MRLGEFEVKYRRFGRAATWLQRATELQPDSADAFNNLGRADEAAYDYFAADRAYQQALRLAPSDFALRTHYAAFRDKLTRNEEAPPLAR
jgi:tetratricopeptide (TPR) repeat protein